MTELNPDKNRRILIIDDNRAIHDDFRKILSPGNTALALDATEAVLFGKPANPVPHIRYQVDSAHQGQEGVMLVEKALAAGRPYALAFVDVRMPPGMDGVETTRKIWELDPDIQVVICTAYADYSWDEMFEKLGNSDRLVILKKPFDTVEALQLAQALTEKWRLHQQSRKEMAELERMVAARTRELGKSLSLLNATFESTADGIVVVNSAGEITSYNTKFAQLWQFPDGMLARRDAAETRAHTAGQVRDPAKFLQRINEMQADPEAEGFDVIELKDGRIFERYVFPQRVNGESVGTVINWRDITGRKQAEAELSRKTAFLEAQVDSSIDGILVVDQQGKQILQNQRMVDLFKIPPAIASEPDDAKQIRWVTDMVRYPKPFLAKVLHLYSHPEEISRDEIELKDGTLLDRYSAPVSGKDGKHYGRIWTFRDITEQRRIQLALKQAKVAAVEREGAQRYSFLADTVPMIIWTARPDGGVGSFNKAWFDYTGFTLAQTENGGWREALHPDDRQRCAECWTRAFTTGENYEIEYRFKRAADGTYRWFLARGSARRNEAGEILQWVGTCTDTDDQKRARAELERQVAERTAELASANETLQAENAERKQAEIALRESNEKFHQLADNITDVFWIRSPDLSEVHYISPAFERIWGRSAKTLQANPHQWADFILPEDRERVLAAFAALKGDDRSLDIEYRITRPDGEIRWVRVRGFQVRNAADQLIRHVGIVTDITQVKLAENLVVQSEERYRSLIDNARDAIFTLAADGTFTSLNPAVETIAGISRADWLGKPFAPMVHPEDRPLAGEMFQRVLRGEPTPVHELRGHPGLPRLAVMEMTLTAQTDEHGKIIGALGIGRDITGRKKAESAAAAFSTLSKELSFVASAEDAARIISEAAHTLLSWDAFAIQLYSAETGIMTPLFDGDTFDGIRIVGPPRPAHKPSEMQQRILQSGAQLILRKPSDSFLPGTASFGDHARPSASLLFVPVRSQGCPVGILTAQSYIPDAYDAEDLRTLQTLADLCGGALERIRVNEALHQSEAQLFESQKLETVGKLAGGIAHEFNSILTAIIGQGELLLEDLPAGSPTTESATEIIKAANRAAALTRQLLAYGRKQFLRPEALNLNQVVAGMDGVLRHLMNGQAVMVTVAPAVDLQPVKADAGQIEQVIMNLVLNARDAMPNGGRLTLETGHVTFEAQSVGRDPELKPGAYGMLAISDTGTGMSAEVKARVFDPFFTTKGVGQGTGLGLSTCYGIIKQSGGHISVYSELGRGTTFKIYLPLAEAPVRNVIARLDSPDLPRGTETILLVEDDPALREMAATLLKRLGYTVWMAANGVEALGVHQARGTGHVDLLFTDVVMPHMSGRELGDRMRALHPRTKILFTSAYTESAITQQGVLEKGVALLQKPFTPSALAKKIREVLDQPATPKPKDAPLDAA